MSAEIDLLKNSSFESKMDMLIAAIRGQSTISFMVLDELPDNGVGNIIYLIPKKDKDKDNVYNEYVWVEPAGEEPSFELIGDTGVTLDGYVTDETLLKLLETKVDKVDGKELSSNDFTDAEKKKLSVIEDGAQVNVIESVYVNGTEQTVGNKKSVSITIPTNTSDLTNNSGFITIDDVPTFTQTQVDWSVADTTSPSYIKNKPTIPNVPTAVSAFTNDAGYITSDDIPEIPTIPSNVSHFHNDAGYINKSVSNLENYTKTEELADVATSGSYNDLSDKPAIPTEQVNADWNATSGKAQILNKPAIPTIPTNVSAFNNDAAYITKSVNNLDNYTATASLADVATSGEYGDLINPPEIPTKVSDLTNDLGFITSANVTGQVQVDWNETNTASVSYIANKPQNLVQDASYVHTDNNYTTAEKNKLQGIENGAQKNVKADWNAASGAAEILNKPTIPIVPTNVSGFANDAGYLTEDALGDFVDTATMEQAIGDAINGMGLANVAFTADYNDLDNTPEIPENTSDLNNDADFVTADEISNFIVQSDWNVTSQFDMAYIKNKPTNIVQDANYVHTDANFTQPLKTKLEGIDYGAEINTINSISVNGSAVAPDINDNVDITVPIVADNLITDDSEKVLSAKQGKKLNDDKQDKLVSGTSIKTINGQTLLGSGDITITGGGASVQVVNSLTSTSTTSALSAAKGKELNENKTKVVISRW